MKTLEHRTKPIAGQTHLTGEHPVTYCKRCGMRLRSEESIKLGYGKRCLKLKNAKK